MTDAAPPASGKRGWPLVALACGSFIPFLGFFIAAAAMTWALVTDRPRVKAAIVISAIGAVLHLVGFVWLAAKGTGSEEFAAAQVIVAQRDLQRIVVELEAYKGRNGEYPRTLQLLVGMPPVRLINIHDQTAGILSQRQYRYKLAPDGSAYDVFAAGRDGEEGTRDDLRPELPDSVLERSGYRPQP